MKGLKKLYCTDERGWGTGVCSLKTEEFEIVELLSRQYLFSQKDVGHMEQLIYKPIYMLPFVLEKLSDQ